jgi:hypothetical protein
MVSEGGLVSGSGEQPAVGLAQQNKVMLANHALDMLMIQRNVRDLAKTASFSHMAELEELHSMAYANLKEKMMPGQPLAEAPDLVMEAFKLISGVLLQTVEVKRKAADTLIKARTLIEPLPVGDVTAGSEDPFDGVPEGAVIQEQGVFGGILSAGFNASEAEDSEAGDAAFEPLSAAGEAAGLL